MQQDYNVNETGGTSNDRHVVGIFLQDSATFLLSSDGNDIDDWQFANVAGSDNV